MESQRAGPIRRHSILFHPSPSDVMQKPTSGPCQLLCVVFLAWAGTQSILFGQSVANEKFDQPDKFRQMDETWPTPNQARTASGAPANGYWQQKVDYEIDVRIDDEKQHLFGSERITYTNNSPDSLRYLWLQLDANIHQPDSDANLTQTSEAWERLEFSHSIPCWPNRFLMEASRLPSVLIRVETRNLNTPSSKP